MSDEPINEGIQADVLHLTARVEALGAVVELLVAHLGGDRNRFAGTMEAATAQSHQAILAWLEDTRPGTAARLDKRPTPIRLDDDMEGIFRPRGGGPGA